MNIVTDTLPLPTIWACEAFPVVLLRSTRSYATWRSRSSIGRDLGGGQRPCMRYKAAGRLHLTGSKINRRLGLPDVSGKVARVTNQRIARRPREPSHFFFHPRSLRGIRFHAVNRSTSVHARTEAAVDHVLIARKTPCEVLYWRLNLSVTRY